MKVVHKTKKETAPAGDAHTGWISRGRQYEAEGETKQAISLYQDVLKQRPLEAYIYDRLMILFRKNKEYRKELSLIESGIKKFEALFASASKKSGHSKKIASLSKSILKSVGLSDKKGVSVYQPQPIARWIKRKRTITNKLQRKK